MWLVMAMVVLVGIGMEVVDGMHVEQSLVGWLHVRKCRSIFRVQGDSLMRPDHTTVPGAVLGRFQSEFAGLPGKALTRDATRRLRFIVHTAG